MYYFTPFSQIQTEEALLTDITQRFTILDSVLDDEESYISYELKDWDTPETLAKQFYGSDQYSWLILLANRALTNNPFSCQYASYPILLNYCKEKYGIKLYDTVKLKDAKTHLPLDEVDTYYYYNQPLKLKNTFVVPITNYDVEYERNEIAKTIKIIKPTLLFQIESEIKNIMVE